MKKIIVHIPESDTIPSSEINSEDVDIGIVAKDKAGNLVGIVQIKNDKYSILNIRLLYYTHSASSFGELMKMCPGFEFFALD